MSKKELRKDVIKAREEMAPVEVSEKSRALVKNIMALEEYRQAGTIMAYVDFRNEVQTGELIRSAMEDGKTVAVPLTDMDNKRLVPSRLENFPGDLVYGTYGILEPSRETLRPLDPGEIDMVIVPGVAFDESGNRLGYGGGFYDRFLLNTRKDCTWVAPAFEMQLKPGVYAGEHDLPVHIIVTEKRIIRCMMN